MDSLKQFANFSEVSIPYRFNETRGTGLRLTLSIFVSIPYRFNETGRVTGVR